MLNQLKKIRESIGGATSEILKWAELIVALYLFALFMTGLYTLTTTLMESGHSLHDHFHDSFEHFLSNILLLIVGVELAMLLIKHRIESIIEIMFFVIARKLAVHTHEIYELAIGIIALAGLFATRKYLLVCKDCKEQDG